MHFPKSKFKVRSVFSKDFNMKYYLFHRLVKYCYASNTTKSSFVSQEQNAPNAESMDPNSDGPQGRTVKKGGNGD